MEAVRVFCPEPCSTNLLDTSRHLCTFGRQAPSTAPQSPLPHTGRDAGWLPAVGARDCVGLSYASMPEPGPYTLLPPVTSPPAAMRKGKT